MTIRANSRINVGGTTSGKIIAGSMVAQVIGDPSGSIPIVPVFANMYHTGASAEVLPLTGTDWAIVDVVTTVDSNVTNTTDVVMNANGEFHNQTGRALKLNAEVAISYNNTPSGQGNNFSIGINNGSGYATNDDDIYDIEQRVKKASFDTVNSKGWALSQTILVPADAKFALLTKNIAAGGEDINVFYYSFKVNEVA